jgi:hypothetical protein
MSAAGTFKLSVCVVGPEGVRVFDPVDYSEKPSTRLAVLDGVVRKYRWNLTEEQLSHIRVYLQPCNPVEDTEVPDIPTDETKRAKKLKSFILTDNFNDFSVLKGNKKIKGNGDLERTFADGLPNNARVVLVLPAAPRASVARPYTILERVLLRLANACNALATYTVTSPHVPTGTVVEVTDGRCCDVLELPEEFNDAPKDRVIKELWAACVMTERPLQDAGEGKAQANGLPEEGTHHRFFYDVMNELGQLSKEHSKLFYEAKFLDDGKKPDFSLTPLRERWPNTCGHTIALEVKTPQAFTSGRKEAARYAASRLNGIVVALMHAAEIRRTQPIDLEAATEETVTKFVKSFTEWINTPCYGVYLSVAS